MKTWMVRSGGRGRLYDEFRTREIVAIGWFEVGDLTNIITREEMVRLVRAAYPNEPEQALLNSAGQLLRFRKELKIGDQVITYDPGARRYACGIIAGEYEYHQDADDEVLRNQRRVRWQHEKSRDDLSQQARNQLGSTLTLFLVSDDVAAELWRTEPTPVVQGNRQKQDLIPTVPEITADSLQQPAMDAIADRIAALSWSDMQNLVAGLLRAMGYKTEVSPPGPDKGKDIIASPDGFGFQEPRIIVEVKHRRGKMGAPEIRSFHGGRHVRDKGLYVSTGGFSREAEFEAERAPIPLKLLDFEGLVQAIMAHYHLFDDETKKLLPLRSILVPA
ncbi:MAG: restriction endonuclease [Beijerinckiaceae bacterium]